MKAKKPVLYLRRRFDAFLRDWRKRDDRLPLIVKGARQVGKTEAVRHFAEESYASFVEINFVERPEFKEIVRDGYSVDSLIRNISIIDPSFRLVPHETLILFDELQEFPEIATSLKFFAQDGRFDVICSGSLLGIQVKHVKSFSVGYQETETLHSLDFEEFLWGCGYRDEQIAGLLDPIMSRRPFGAAVKNTMDRLFMDYCVTGGMPNVLETYFVNGTFERVPQTQRRILEDYREDIRKYAEGLDPVRIQAVFDSIPVHLAKENRKFQWSSVSKGATRRDFWGCVEWLEDAGVVNKCRRLDVPELPLGAHLDNDAYKLYLCDSGLLLAMLDKEVQEDVRIRRNLGTWKGGFFEHVVGEAMVKAGMPLAYYKRENSTLEMDFFARSADCMVPVEVKAENRRAKSLRTLIDRDTYKDVRWGVKLVNGNVGYENRVLTLPQWCAFLLPTIIGKFNPESCV